MASNNVETYVLTVNAGERINVITGTTSLPTTNAHMAHKGKSISFQCQHATAKVKVGGVDVVSLGGLQLTTNFAAPYTVSPSSDSYCAINAADWYVTSDTATTTVVVQLVKSI